MFFFARYNRIFFILKLIKGDSYRSITHYPILWALHIKPQRLFGKAEFTQWPLNSPDLTYLKVTNTCSIQYEFMKFFKSTATKNCIKYFWYNYVLEVDTLLLLASFKTQSAVNIPLPFSFIFIISHNYNINDSIDLSFNEFLTIQTVVL